MGNHGVRNWPPTQPFRRSPHPPKKKLGACCPQLTTFDYFISKVIVLMLRWLSKFKELVVPLSQVSTWIWLANKEVILKNLCIFSIFEKWTLEFFWIFSRTSNFCHMWTQILVWGHFFGVILLFFGQVLRNFYSQIPLGKLAIDATSKIWKYKHAFVH